MKTYIWTASKVTVSRTYGGSNVTANIYRIKNNKPEFVGEAKWCTRSFRGEFHEVAARLVELKELPKNALNGPSSYGYAKRDDKRFEILQVS